MTKTVAIAPVRKSLAVKASQSRAFEVFTAGIHLWWPQGHTLLKVAMKDRIIEPFVGGRWFDRGVDGSEVDTGRVLVWQPPERLVLSWQLNAQWQYDPDLITEIEVRFIAESDRQTRVEFEHRNLERMGDAAPAVRSQIDPGWGTILESFGRQASEG